MSRERDIVTQELQAFMRSIGKLESGGRYHILGPQTKYGRPRGKYQILDSNWDAWAREAGIPNADWRDPSAQERVASYKFLQYYNQFGGRWDAVAVAWFAGPGRARKWVKNPNSVGGMADVLGTSVATYVQKAMNGMQSNLGRDPLELGFQNFAVNDPSLEVPQGQVVSVQDAADTAMDTLRGLFTTGRQEERSDLNIASPDEVREAAVSDVDPANLETRAPQPAPEPSPGSDQGSDLTPEQKRLLKGGL